MIGALIGCVSPTTADHAIEIIFGTETAGDPAVVGVVIGGEVSCTGTVIDPRVVVTAAHCAILAPTAVRFGQGTDPDATIAVTTALAHPDFGYLGLVDDVGALILAADAPAVPIALAPTTPAVGTQVRLVGYGITTIDGTAGVKHEGTARVTAVTDDELSLGPDPATPCRGDSGGPVLADLGQGEQLIGVVSSGDAACTAADIGRADVHGAFLTDLVRRAHAPGATGAACWSDAGCAVGACVQFEPDSRGVCAPRCGTGCPDGWRCASTGQGAGWCRPAAALPGTTGEVCTDDLDCATGECARVTGDPVARCWSPCAGSGQACLAGGGTCEATDRPALEVCVPGDGGDGGCSASGRPGGLAVVWVGAWWLGLRRRRAQRHRRRPA